MAKISRYARKMKQRKPKAYSVDQLVKLILQYRVSYIEINSELQNKFKNRHIRDTIYRADTGKRKNDEQKHK